MSRKILGLAALKRIGDQTGQALILVLILLLLGSLIIPPLLGFMATGIRTGVVYEKKTSELYAADAGIEDARWQIKYDRVKTFKTPVAYNPYDFDTVWPYRLSEPVNGKAVDVTIQNMWIPKDVPAPNQVPDEGTARGIIEANRLIVTGTTVTTGIDIGGGVKISQYRIKVSYYPKAGEDFKVETLGIWLPYGFQYYTNGSAYKSNLEKSGTDYNKVPGVESHGGNQAVIWDYSTTPVLFTKFPGKMGDTPRTMEVTFYFKPPQAPEQVGQSPNAVAWIGTDGTPYGFSFSWDADVKLYKMTSWAHNPGEVAGGTTIEAYAAKSELRELNAAIPGDYSATGNSLMIDTDPIHDGYYREQLLSNSDATVNNIPTDATVERAFLYWTGWFKPFEDDCSNFDNWYSGSCWNISSGSFRGHYSSGADSTRYLITMKNSQYLGSCPEGGATVSWDQWVSHNDGGPTPDANDRLYFAFSNDDGATWSADIKAFSGDIGGSSSNPVKFSYAIPKEYLAENFKIRFYLFGFSGNGECCYINNIKITTTTLLADTSAIFKIDGQQVYYDSNGLPQKGNYEIIADPNNPFGLKDRVQVMLNESEHGYSYSCRKDVTELVRSFSKEAPYPATNHPGNATYTVGSVKATWDQHDEWAYAGWSLLIIYRSSETTGHQLYLYDDFRYSGMDQNVDFDGDGKPGGTITGFIVPQRIKDKNGNWEVNAAKLTVFVGEGDLVYSGDYVAIRVTTGTTKLWDGITCSGNSKSSPNNVWNSKSLVGSADGVDVDTLGIDPGNGKYITWDSNILNPGDTSAQIDMYTQTDSWNLVYIVLSFRSATTTGGSLSYLIR